MNRQSSLNTKRAKALKDENGSNKHAVLPPTYLSDKTVFVIPVGHSISIKLQGMLHDNARKHGVRIANKAKEADILVAVSDVLLVAVKSYLGGVMPHTVVAELSWLRTVLASKSWIDPSSNDQWLWRGYDQSGLLVTNQQRSQAGGVDSAFAVEVENWVPREFPQEFSKSAIALLELFRSGAGQETIPGREKAIG